MLRELVLSHLGDFHNSTVPEQRDLTSDLAMLQGEGWGLRNCVLTKMGTHYCSVSCLFAKSQNTKTAVPGRDGGTEIDCYVYRNQNIIKSIFQLLKASYDFKPKQHHA